jgi:two-component system sensor histidine kinase/response regulator
MDIKYNILILYKTNISLFLVIILLYCKGVATTQNRIPIFILPSPTDICDNVLTDKHWLQENMLCYLSNAVKYSSSGKVTVRVYVCDGQIRIVVEDQGIGMSQQSKADLFQPFQQTMRLAGGTGLGLYSLAKRIDALGGQFGVAGRDDGAAGSQFWFSIPYVPDFEFVRESSQITTTQISRFSSSSFLVESEIKSESDSSSSAGSNTKLAIAATTEGVVDDKNGELVDSSAFRPPTALIVEDSLVISKSTRRMLRKAGYVVDSAENGAIGLDKMKSKLYDVVLMDLQMPIMDGLEATRR